MTCHTHIDAAAAERAQILAMDRAMDNPALRSGPALNIAKQPNAGALNAMIASRCKRLRHANNVQRLRYLEKHRLLATYSAGDA